MPSPAASRASDSLQDLAQPLEILLGGPRAGEFGRLDLVDFPELDGLVDLDRIERHAGLGKQRHGLDARLAGGEIDAGLRPPLDDAHRFEDRQRLADLAAAHRKMLGKLALGRRAARLAVRAGEQIGGEFGEQVLVFHDQALCA